MLGLPKTTELSRQLPKKSIYARFNMNTAAREKFDADVSRIVIVNEVSPATITIKQGNAVPSFFVLHVSLKRKEYDTSNIALLSKLIPQNMLYILAFEDDCQLAVYHTKLIHTSWRSADDCTVQLKGLDFDAVWENIVMQIGSIEVERGNSLTEQIAVNEKRAKLEREIARIEKLARAEKQPKKKFEYVQQINKLKKQLEV